METTDASATDVTRLALDLLGSTVTFHTQRPGRPETTADWPSWVDPAIRQAVVDLGMERPWGHQVAAADAVWHGSDVVLATGTASGKSLAYLLPALTWARRSARRQRAATLYVAPTKALAADQAAAIDRLAAPGVRSAVVDGDSTREERDWARRYADIVLTNPDMLHRSLLPSHQRWQELFGGLRLVVVDEAHHYRGVFGSHVAWVLRRLSRVAAGYGADPRLMLLSATSADPVATGRRLCGRPVRAVVDDDSPSGPLDVVLCDTTRERTPPGQQAWSAALLAGLAGAGHQTIAFLRSRRGTESVAARANQMLLDRASPVSVAAYRGGYLPEERRSIERRLRERELGGVAATTALELGVDLAGLDAVLVTGWPGTRSAFWQQAGRAGRGARDALVVFLGGADPLEQYVAHHPEVLIGAPLERTVIDPDNPYVIAPQVCAAAAERPLRTAELDGWGPPARLVVDELTDTGVLRYRGDGWYWPRAERPSDSSDIRGGAAAAIRLVEQDTGRLLGTVDAARAPATVHPGAVYVHQGATFVVTELAFDEAVAFVVPTVPEYETQARTVSEVRVVSEQRRQSWGPATVSLGTVDVARRVVGYLKRRWDTGTVLAEAPLDLPEQRLRTAGCWWTVPDEVLAETDLRAAALAGAAHAAEHASIGLLPLFATCDRWDIGGVSTARHPDTDRLTVVVHDAHPGGAGFASRGYEAAVPWLTATRDLIADCRCGDGCPSCVQSPKCGNGNSPLDKAGAITLLSVLLRRAPTTTGPA